MREKRFCCLFILRVILLEFLKKLIRTYQGFLVAFKSTYQTDFHNRLWRLHHTKVLASLSNGSRFPSSLKDLGFKAQWNSHEPIQVPVGPMTRARAKRFKEELNNLVQRVLQQEESVFATDGEQRLILLIKFDPEESQD